MDAQLNFIDLKQRIYIQPEIRLNIDALFTHLFDMKF